MAAPDMFVLGAEATPDKPEACRVKPWRASQTRKNLAENTQEFRVEASVEPSNIPNRKGEEFHDPGSATERQPA
jgi:hypothetical protein